MKPRIPSLAVATAVLAGFVPAAAGAQTTQNRFGGTASATTAYSNNPFSEAGGSNNTSSPLVVLDVSPTYQHLTQHSVLAISADVNLQQYLRRYGSNPSYSGSVDYSLRPAEWINTHLRLDLSSAVLGSFNSFVPSIAATAPVTADVGSASLGAAANVNTAPIAPVLAYPTSPFLTDVGLYGLRQRRRTGRAAGDARIGITDRDSLTVSAYTEVTRYGGGFTLADYEAYSGTLGYQRRVSTYVNVGLQGTASVFDYRTIGNTHAYALEATVSGRLSPHWKIDGALGVTFADGGSSGSTSQTSPSGSINLCRQSQHFNICAQASRQVSPTGVNGSQYVTTVGLNWSEPLSERDSVSFNASYSDIGGGRNNLVVPGGVLFQSQYAQASVGYHRQLRQRFSLVATANVRQLLDDNVVSGVGRPVDVGGQVGIAYQFGSLR